VILFSFSEQVLPIVLLVIFSGLVSWPISLILRKFNPYFVFIVPGILGTLGVVLWILGLLSTDWGRLGFLLYGSIALGGFVGSLLVSLWIWFKKKKHNE
jgi:hypothetical protein